MGAAQRREWADYGPQCVPHVTEKGYNSDATGFDITGAQHSWNALKRTEEPISPLERTFALRQGFKPLPDYRFYVKLSPIGRAWERVD
jgi:hypothetical protein